MTQRRRIRWASMFAMLAFSVSAMSQDMQISVFTEALNKGHASVELPNDQQFAPLVQAIRGRTGSNGQIMVFAKLITRFKKQPTCGRVAFLVSQPSAHIAWDDLGGQLNICQDGLPPRRMCKSHPGHLYPVGSPCPDGTPPQDTAEVEAAIKHALATGGLSNEQVRAKAVKAAQMPTGEGGK
jgi:hypothetical protein